MMEQGLSVLAVGLVTVFGFLGVLVVLMQISGRLFQAYGGGEEAPTGGATASPASGTDDAEIAAVIAIAERWRREHER